MTKKRIVILGSNVAGYAAALALKEQLRTSHDVVVISRTDQFVFHPSLIRLSLGARTAKQTAFPVRAPFAQLGVTFRDESALRIDLERRKVVTPTTEERYDFLVIATGTKANYGAVPGLGPRGFTQSIMTLTEAEQARSAFEGLVRSPGPVVIGDVQGSSCRRPACEFLLNLARELEQRGLSRAAPLTHLTAGLGFCEKRFQSISQAAIAEITPGEIRLADGRRLPFAYAMLLPSFLGVDVVRACEKITDASGFVRVNEFEQTEAYPEVFAAGTAVAGEPLEKSGEHAERSAQRVAGNIAAMISGQPLVPIAPRPPESSTNCQISSDGDWLVPGPAGAWAQRAFARYFPSGSGDPGH